jgi:phosphonate transport system ATP-binding protein
MRWVNDMNTPVDPAIALAQIRKTYGSRRVLDEVSLRVEPGEMVALIGPSGAGKSTLMRHISGLVTSDPGWGEVRVGGAVVQQGGRLAADVRRQRRHVGFVFQQFNLVGRLSLLENVLIGNLASMPWYRRGCRWFTVAEQRKAMQALDFVGMADYAPQRASTLSGGQQQRAAIARVLMQQANVLLADEPIASLDPESARLVMEGLRRLNQQESVTVVVSLHQVDYAQRFCDRIVAMKAGRIESDLAAQSLRPEHLQAIYGANYASWSESSTEASMKN